MSEVKEIEVAGKATSTFLPAGFTVGSREVEVKHIEKFSMLPKDPSIRKEVVKKLGSVWVKGTRDVLRGLDSSALYVDEVGNEKFVNEEELYLPRIVGISVDSPNWEERTKLYWADFMVEVPADGIKLEVGFRKDGTPIKLGDYISYKFILGHPHAAATEAELDNKFLEQYEVYVLDKQKERIKELEDFDVISKAGVEFARIVAGKNPELLAKVDYILEMEGGERGMGINVLNMSDKEKLFNLNKFKDANPARFIQVLRDENLATKAMLRKCVTFGHISKEGDAYYLNDKKIGVTLMEAVAFLDDKSNSDVRLKLQDKLIHSQK